VLTSFVRRWPKRATQLSTTSGRAKAPYATCLRIEDVSGIGNHHNGQQLKKSGLAESAKTELSRDIAQIPT
jgi:hypothetical protein